MKMVFQTDIAVAQLGQVPGVKDRFTAAINLFYKELVQKILHCDVHHCLEERERSLQNKTAVL